NMNMFLQTEARYSRMKTANILRMQKRVSEGIVLRLSVTPWKGRHERPRGKCVVCAVADGHRFRCRVSRACTADGRNGRRAFQDHADGRTDTRPSDLSRLFPAPRCQ